MTNIVSIFKKLPLDLTKKDYNVAINNYEKNNFNNVLATEESRVKLNDGEYINANWITDNIIATQEPSNGTINDFWNMIVENNVQMVINLTTDYKYLSEVQVVNQISMGKIQLRKICVGGIDLYHVTFLAWDDFCVPDQADFGELLNIVELLYVEMNRPMVVHCRAGIGRTGTFILIYRIMLCIKRGIPYNIIELVKDMRKRRYGMVQTTGQFKFALDYKFPYSSNSCAEPRPPVEIRRDNIKKLSSSLGNKLKSIDIISQFHRSGH